MFEIKYQFTRNQPEIVNEVDEVTLRYELFLGSLWLNKDDKEISMNWKWVPLADFALCMFDIYNLLNKQTVGEEVFEFTESDATITFRREKDKCKISASFSDVILKPDYSEFREAVKLFCKKIGEDIFCQNKELKEKYKKFILFAGLT